MLLYPHAKINLGLYVTEKRPDGFHNLETVFYPVPLNDVLELNLLPEEAQGQCMMHVANMEVGEITDNLAMQAYRLLNHRFSLPAVQVYLHKQIPAGAGLGGGSADAAFMLCGLNRLCGLKLSRQQLMAAAAQLGSDCPYFICGRPVFAWGRGECMKPVRVDLSGYYITIVKVPEGISTAEAFSGILPQKPSFNLRNLSRLPVEQWQNSIENQFEANAGRLIPDIIDVKSRLIASGAVYASMTGSGSAVFGLFRKAPGMLDFPPDYFQYTALIHDTRPSASGF